MLDRFLQDAAFPTFRFRTPDIPTQRDAMGPIEGGTARLAVWCLEDLERQGRDEEILISPEASLNRLTLSREE